MAGSTKRWDKKTYQEHIFDLARGKKSRHEKKNGPAKSRGWFNLTFDQDSMSDMFEENSVRGSEGHTQARDASGETYTAWDESGGTERGRFRQDQQEALKQQFRRNIGKHPAFQGMTKKEIADIANKYLAGDDFEGDDKKEIAAALSEVADYTTGGNEAPMSDEATWRKTYPRAGNDASPGKETGAVAGRSSSAGPANGTPQATPAGGGQQADALKPRNGPAQSQIGAGGTNRFGERGDSTGISIGGAPLSSRNSSAKNALENNQRNIARREELQSERELARDRADAKSDTRRNTQGYYDTQDALDRHMNERMDRKRAEREAAEQRRKDKRYGNRTLVNKDDWENLGREGSNRRNYEEVQGETAEQKAEREAALAKRKGSIDELRNRFEQMSDRTLIGKGEKAEWIKGRRDEQGNWVAGRYKVTDANGNEVLADELKRRAEAETGVGESKYSYQNKFYANDPNRQKELAGLGKLVTGAGDNITDAQMEGVAKTLDSWQAESDARGAQVKAYQDMNKAEQVSNLRRQYGLTDRSISADAVLNFHKEQQKAARDEILKGMSIAPELDQNNQANGSFNKNAMTKFSQQWQQLIDNGFDPQATFAKAMENPDTKNAYMEGMKAIKSSDPDAADKRDQLRRRFIMQEAMGQARLAKAGGENGQVGAQMASSDKLAQNLPGKKALYDTRADAESAEDMQRIDAPLVAAKGNLKQAVDFGQDALQPKRAGGPDGVTIVHSAQEARNAANQINQQVAAGNAAAASVPPEKKKKEQGVADMKGGMSALRPRRRY